MKQNLKIGLKHVICFSSSIMIWGFNHSNNIGHCCLSNYSRVQNWHIFILHSLLLGQTHPRCLFFCSQKFEYLRKRFSLIAKYYHSQIPDYLYTKRKELLIIENMVLVTMVMITVVMLVVNKEERQEDQESLFDIGLSVFNSQVYEEVPFV